MTGAQTVAVLGAGVMGGCTALSLAERGVRTFLFDEAPRPLSAASRWNEGKIHLGFLYSASGSLRTAKRVIPGGLAFRPLIERRIGRSIENWITPEEDVFLFHRDSVVDFETAYAYFKEVTALACAYPHAEDYLGPISERSCRKLTASEIEALAEPSFIAGAIHAPERSVATQPVADALCAAIENTPEITLAMGNKVTRARLVEQAARNVWFVETADQTFGPFDAIVNALWQGRPALDAASIQKTDRETHHRYRVSAFIEAKGKTIIPSAVIAAGPFGDVKNYGGGRYYASWYPAGLLAQGEGIAPPPTPTLDEKGKAKIAEDIRRGLSPILPGVTALFGEAADIKIEGGWVYAKGSGRLEDPSSSLHHRSLLGETQHDAYFSVDTGKYSVAPLLAETIAEKIAQL